MPQFVCTLLCLDKLASAVYNCNFKDNYLLYVVTIKVGTNLSAYVIYAYNIPFMTFTAQ